MTEPAAVQTQRDTNAGDEVGDAPTLQVVLFYDGYVCRHRNKAGQWVEGFAQPYDGESRFGGSTIG